MSTPLVSGHRLSRRSLIGSSVVGGALLPLAAAEGAFAAPARATHALGYNVAATPAGPTGWRTWHLKSPDELRPAKPGTPGKDEIEAIVGFQSNPTDDMKAAIAMWGV